MLLFCVKIGGIEAKFISCNLLLDAVIALFTFCKVM